MDFVFVIVIKDYLVMEIYRYSRDDVQEAEDQFVDCLSAHLSNFGEYTQGDIKACIEDGYEGFGTGNSVQIFWADDDINAVAKAYDPHVALMKEAHPVATEMRAEAKALREDTLVSLMEGACNERLAIELEHWAKRIDGL